MFGTMFGDQTLVIASASSLDLPILARTGGGVLFRDLQNQNQIFPDEPKFSSVKNNNKRINLVGV
jgi:hypothetical protein